ncbi:hypothetical protein J3R82DRAFT_8849, partial [Butyriboletus roseoflavus]
LTPETIHTAFQVTGVWPFNPEVIASDKMAPSLKMSVVRHLPITQSSPIQALVSVM